MVTEMSVWGNVRSGNVLVGKCSLGEVSVGEVSGRGIAIWMSEISTSFRCTFFELISMEEKLYRHIFGTI